MVLVGDVGIGKTSLLLRFTEGDYYDSGVPATLALDFKRRSVMSSDNQQLDLLVWDTGGQERFRNLTVGFYRKAAGIMLVFDLTNEQSWNNVPCM